jgi:ribosomal protein S18 acetylase RimI-like enzyme
MQEIAGQRSLLLANLLDTMRTFALVRETAEIWEEDGLLCVYSGLPGAIFNSVLLTRPVATEEELKIKFDYVRALYKSRRARWSLWLVEDLVTANLLGRMEALVDRYGLRMVSRGTGMFAPELKSPLRNLPKLDIRPVLAPATRFDFCYVMAIAFKTPLNTFLDVYHTVEYWRSPMRGFVAYSANRAVATACVMPAHDVLGVYGVSVLPDVQRKGIGERTVRYALAQVSAETGLGASVLESSEIAHSLYRRMGYQKITGLSIYNETR